MCEVLKTVSDAVEPNQRQLLVFFLHFLLEDGKNRDPKCVQSLEQITEVQCLWLDDIS